VFLDHFDAPTSKIFFFKMKKNIILIHFQIKNTLKNKPNYTSKHVLSRCRGCICKILRKKDLILTDMQAGLRIPVIVLKNKFDPSTNLIFSLYNPTSI
jgi:hypothetical protein